MRIQVKQGGGGAWYYRVVSYNGQVMLTSETYASRSNARRAARQFADALWRTDGDIEVEDGRSRAVTR